MQYASERGNNEDGPKEFITLFKTCTRPKDGYKIEGICTRVIRIKEADYSKPRRLAGDDPTRKIVFLSNSAASMNLLGTSGFECLVQIGYPEEWIRQLLLPGPNQRSFEMIAFPERSCNPATWKGLLEVVTIAYPDVKEDCEKHLDRLVVLGAESRDRGWGYCNRLLGFDIGKQERGMQGFMSVENYMRTSREVAYFRAFLAHTCYANKLYSGDGFTYNDAGEKQSEEFVMFDAAIDDIEGASFCEMNVAVPPSVN